MTKISAIATVLMMSFVLAACSGKSVREGVGVDERNTGDGTNGGISSTGINDGTSGGGQNVGSDGTSGSGSGDGSGDGTVDPLNVRTLYFEYDSAELTTESREVVEAHAGNMGSNVGLALILEGHADERGTREYNVALGEERAQNVARLLQALGVESARVETVSYGEERPAMIGDGESSWSKNRRVELSYTN